MAKKKDAKTVVVAANEDGWGPSSLVYYIVMALIRQAEDKKIPIKIILLNSLAMKLNSAFYKKYIKAGEIELQNIDSYLKMEKENGEVHVPKTLERWIRYKEERNRYEKQVFKILKDAAFSIDFGVPFLSYCANQAGITNYTIFDHSWACTLRGVCSKQAKYNETPTPTYADRIFAYQISKEIEEDEKLTDKVFLFPKCITPQEFYDHWKNLGKEAHEMNKVLGTPEPQKAHAELNSLLSKTKTCKESKLKQKPVGKGKPLVLISPGGTPIWDSLLPKIVDDYTKKAPKEMPYTPILSDPRIDQSYKEKMLTNGKIKWIGKVEGSTLQKILPAFSMIVTRAGGGTVNDCLACNVPFICIEEHMWQVELIARECKKQGLTPVDINTDWEIFKGDPVGCIDYFFSNLRSFKPKIIITGGEEEIIAEQILGEVQK